MEIVDFWLDVGKEFVEKGGYVFRLGQIEATALLLALVENSLASVLENGVGERITVVDFLLNFGIEVVVSVLSLPKAAAIAEEVTESGVREDGTLADLELLFGNEFPAVGF